MKEWFLKLVYLFLKRNDIMPRDKCNRPHGLWLRYYNNGFLNQKHYWIHGRLHGYYLLYWDNGKLYEKGHYLNGFKYGLWEYYNQKGKLIFKERFHNKERKLYLTNKNKLLW